MKSGSISRLLFLLTVGGLSVWSSTASAGPDWCHGNACDFVQLSINAECHTVTNTSPNKAMTVQWGLYDPFSLRPNQSNTIMFQGQCVDTIVGAFNATFLARAPAPAPALAPPPVTQSAPATPQPPPQWTSAETEVRDIMVRTCLINMPVYVVWVDPDGSFQGPTRVWANPSWPRGAPIIILGTDGTSASTRYRTAWAYAETAQGVIIGGEFNPQNTDRIFRFSENLQREDHLPKSARFAAVRLTGAQWLGDVDDPYLYKAWRADLTCP
jgi:hypothetical protein